jgi:hypothetical protein
MMMGGHDKKMMGPPGGMMGGYPGRFFYLIFLKP